MTKKSSSPQVQESSFEHKNINDYLFCKRRSNCIKNILERALDTIGSLLLIIIFLPLFFIIAVLIKMERRGPVFFFQKRCGKNGIEFNMYKFRTMVKEAEFLKKNLKNEIDGPMFKMKNDPRVTRVGRFLRNWNLDELPQCFNVLKGEMSLVGPRPLSDEEMDENSLWKKTRISVKPGLTGLWQIKGKGSGKFSDWIKYDIEYVEKKSLFMNIKILFLTVVTFFMNKDS